MVNKQHNLNIVRETIVDKIYYIVEHQILSGKLAPGAKLSEAKVAKEFNVSRAPAREALLRLEGANLLEKSHLGRSVIEFSIEEYREVYEIKNVIESYAAMKATLYATKRDFKTLEMYLNEMFESIEPLNFERLFELNKLFHDHIVHCCSNKRLVELYDLRVKPIRTSISVRLRYKDIVKEHKLIYDAFIKRDGKKVRELMEIHTMKGMDSVISQMISSGKT